MTSKTHSSAQKSVYKSRQMRHKKKAKMRQKTRYKRDVF